MSFLASLSISPWVQHRCCEGALVDVLHKLDQLKEAAGRIGTSVRERNAYNSDEGRMLLCTPCPCRLVWKVYWRGLDN